MISVLDMNQEFYSQMNALPFSHTKRKTFRKVNGAQEKENGSMGEE